MNLYRKLVLPLLMDRSMHSPALNAARRAALAGASGRILEVGFGTGANLPHYPDWVARLEAVEPDAALARRGRANGDRWGGDLVFHLGDGEALPFENRVFDTVVTSFTLCSANDPRRVLEEIARVLRPGGRYLFLEHGLSPDPRVACWQHRLDPLQRRLAGGCRLTRDIGDLLAKAPLSAVEAQSGYGAGLPRPAGYLTLGHAVACRHRASAPAPHGFHGTKPFFSR